MGIQVEQAPEYMTLRDENGEPVTKKVSLDIKITVGAGLPSNKAFIYSIIKESSNLLPPHVQLRLLREYVGLPVSDDDIAAVTPQPQAQQPMQMPLNPDVAGLTPNGNPMNPATNPAIGGIP
jgi:hypothetical protein